MTDLIRPTGLTPGGTIGVAALSGPPDPGRLDRGISRLRSNGYRVVEASNLRLVRGLFAGDDRERAAGYRELLLDAEVGAIFFARGGYGAARVLAHLDPGEIASSRKPHLGGSDLTALFAMLGRIPFVAFYGPMVAVEMATEGGLDWQEVLSGAVPVEHRFEPGDVIAGGEAEGRLVGGCLTLLASLCGTPEALSADGALLFWEDIGEEIYRLDRLLTQLERSGTFDRIQGMIVGSVVSRDRAETPERVREYLRDRFRGCPFPVAAGLPAGHLPRPRTLPLHAPARLLLDGGPPRLVFPAPAVAAA
jgi:muramoyltetrapeptide carboxypeptidase